MAMSLLLGGNARATPYLVMLAPRDKPKATATLRAAVEAQMSDVHLKLRVRSVAALPQGHGCRLAGARELVEKRDVAAVFWFDATANRVCLLFSRDRGGGLVNRRVAGAGEEGRFEAVAVLVRTAVRASPPRRHSRGASPGPAGLLPGRRLVRPGLAWLELELAYSLELMTTSDVGQGLRLAAQLRLHRHWTLYVGYRLEARLTLEGDDESVELQRYPVDAGARFRWWFGPFEIGARAGLGFAYSRLFQRLPSTSSNAVKATSEWLVFLDARFYVGVRPVPRLLLYAGVGARFYVLNAEYRLNGDDVVFTPWPVQPSLMVGLSVDLF